MGLNLRLYTNDGLLVQRYGEPSKLRFTTKLPGGYDTLECYVGGTLASRFAEADRPLARRAVLSDSGAEPIWAGRLSETEVGGGSSRLRFVGYWYSLWDGRYSEPDPGVASPAYPHTILTRILSRTSTQLSQSTDQIDTTNTLDLAAGAAYIRPPGRPGDAITDLLKVGSPTGEQFYAAVYNRRVDGASVPVLYYFKRRSTPTWYVSLSDLENDWSFRPSWDAVWSSVQFEYTDLDGTRQRSRVYSDADTQRRIGYPKDQFLTLPETTRYDATAVDRIAALYLAEHDRPKQRTSGFTVKTGSVRDFGGVKKPSYLVKAGDVVRITDLPTIGDSSGTGPDDRRTFNVVSTDYSADTFALRIVPDYPPDDLATLLAKLAAR